MSSAVQAASHWPRLVPHATCLYPNAVEHGLNVLKPWGEEVTRKVMSTNAAKLYKIDL